MAKIELLSNDKVSDKTREMFENYKAQKGFEPNILRAISHNENLLHNFRSYSDTIAKNWTLGEEMKELVVMLIATLRDCNYCYYLHKLVAKKLGVSMEKADNIGSYKRRSDLFSAEEMAVLTFVDDSIRYGHHVPDKTFSNVRGFYTDSQIVEIVIFIGMILTTTTINNVFDVDLPEGV